MGQKFTDAARAELAANITPGNTLIYLASGGELFPVADTGTSPVSDDKDWFKAVIQDTNHFEIVYVRTHQAGSDTFSNVLRGQEGTTARAFEAGATIGLRQTAQDAQASYDHQVAKDNPHNVTKAQVGLGNVDNTSDLDKPISTATQAALDEKADITFVEDAIENAEDTYIVITESTTAQVNKSYWIGADISLTLPSSAVSFVGDKVVVSKGLAYTASVMAPDGSQIITTKESTSEVLLDINAEVVFVFNGTDWEI